MQEAVMEVGLPFETLGTGENKVREIYYNLIPWSPTEDGPETGLMLCTDRVSAYNVVLKSGIPLKGIALNLTAAFWFQQTASICPNHFIRVVDDSFFDANAGELPWNLLGIQEVLTPFKNQIINRSLLFEIVEPVMMEAIVRNKLLGSGWDSYQKTREVCGIKLPEGLKKGDELPAPILTPTRKSKDDEPLTYEGLIDLVGESLAMQIRAYSLSLYCYGQTIAALKNFEVDDTKFEFGIDIARNLKQIDESLTGDSSRYKPDLSKQIVRDYLDSIGFDRKTSVELPPEIIEKTKDAYVKMCKIITGKDISKL